jgi:glycosyltransferase involved in cell wall biosynthesis
LKRLLVVSGFWPTSRNAISGIFVVQQVAALARLGYHVTVLLERPLGAGRDANLSPSELGLRDEHVSLHQVPVFRLPQMLLGLPGALRLNVFLVAKATQRVIRSLTASSGVFAACIVHGARYFAWTLPRWRACIAGQTCVVLHGVDPFLERPEMRNQIAALFADAAHAIDVFVLVGTPLVAHAQSLGISPDRVQVIHNGTDLPPLSSVHNRQRRAPGTRSIVSVSNLIPLKGIDLNLQALAQIKNSQPELKWSYTVVGDGPERRRLEELAARLELSDSVRFTGRLDYADSMKEIQDADVFCLPSWGEAFGIVYLEAMARMRLAIGCKNNGAAEIISDGIDGLLVAPLDAEGLRDVLRRALVDPVLCERLGSTARTRAESFTWNRNASHMLAVLGIDEGTA